MNKILIIGSTDAVIQPEAVMIELVTTSITRFAMFCIILNDKVTQVTLVV